MAVTITSQKAKEKAQVKTATKDLPKVEVGVEEMSLGALADLYGDLEDKVTALKMQPEFQQLENVKKELLSRLAHKLGPEETDVISGKHYDVEVGVAAKKARQVEDVAKVMELIGKEAFLSLAKIGVTDAQKYLTGEQLEMVCSTPGYTLNRKLIAKFKG